MAGTTLIKFSTYTPVGSVVDSDWLKLFRAGAWEAVRADVLATYVKAELDADFADTSENETITGDWTFDGAVRLDKRAAPAGVSGKVTFYGDTNGVLHGINGAGIDYEYVRANGTAAISAIHTYSVAPKYDDGALFEKESSEPSGVSGYVKLWADSNGEVNAKNGTGISYELVRATRTIELLGTANEVEVSAGAQDLSANRSWTIGLPADVVISNSFAVTGISTLRTILAEADSLYDIGLTGSRFRAGYFDTIDATTLTGTISTAAQPNISSLGTIVSLVATSADINGGTIDGAVIGGSVAAAGSFTTLGAAGAAIKFTNDAVVFQLGTGGAGGSAPIFRIDKGSNADGKIEFSRNDGANIDWEINHNLNEQFTIQGIRQDEDFYIKVNDGGSTITPLWIDTPNGGLVNLLTTSIGNGENFVLGGTTTAASATNTIHIYNGTAPTASITEGIALYAEDVSLSSELRVRDEAGNVTTLSPHNRSRIPYEATHPLAHSYYSERVIDDKKWWINIDEFRLAELVETMSGEQVIFATDRPEIPRATKNRFKTAFEERGEAIAHLQTELNELRGRVDDLEDQLSIRSN